MALTNRNGYIYPPGNFVFSSREVKPPGRLYAAAFTVPATLEPDQHGLPGNPGRTHAWENRDCRGYIPARAVPSVMNSLGSWGSGRPFPALPGLPGSSTDLSLRACPQSPRKVRRVLAHCFPADIRLHPSWRTGHLHQCHEAESGSLALRLAGLPPRFPPAGLLRLAPARLHARTSNLHGEFLSIHKISQA